MSADIKAYPAYKESGMQWTDEIPNHWNTIRLRYICKINPSKQEINKLPKHYEVTFLPMENISEDGEIDNTLTKELGEVIQGYTYFREGDVLVAKITPCFENGKGGIVRNLANGIGFGTTELHILRPNE